MKISFAFTTLFLFAIMLRADTVITNSVTCGALGFQTVTGNTFCEAGSYSGEPLTPPYGSASSAASVQYQQTASDPLTINILSSGTAIDGLPWYHSQGLYLNYQSSASGFASASTTIHLDLATYGPQRQGIFKMDVIPLWQAGYGDTSARATFNIADDHFHCGGSSFVTCDTPGPNAPFPLILTLGTVFSFDADANYAVDSMDGNQTGYAGLLLKFNFFEEDGVTPFLAHQSAPVPEPSNLASVGLAGFLLLLVGMVKRRSKVQAVVGK